MKKQVRILVIGDTDHAAPEILRQGKEHHQLTYCARGDHAVGSNNQSGRYYDWIVIDGGSLGGDETDLIQSLRAMGLLLPREECKGQRRCGVEWSQDGVLQLRCCMQGPKHKSRKAIQHAAADKQQNGFVFEYHAPVKRTG